MSRRHGKERRENSPRPLGSNDSTGAMDAVGGASRRWLLPLGIGVLALLAFGAFLVRPALYHAGACQANADCPLGRVCAPSGRCAPRAALPINRAAAPASAIATTDDGPVPAANAANPAQAAPRATSAASDAPAPPEWKLSERLTPLDAKTPLSGPDRHMPYPAGHDPQARLVRYDFPPPRALEPGFCRHSLTCEEPATCNLATGRCEMRIANKAVLSADSPPEHPRVLDAYPREVMVGDAVVVDGFGLYYESMEDSRQWVKGRWVIQQHMSLLSKLWIGDFQAPWSSFAAPEDTRLVFKATEPASGPLTVTADFLDVAARSSITLSIKRGPRGVIACGPDDPPAPGQFGGQPFHHGPHGAAFVDVEGPDGFTRIYYPGQCGGMRRPPATGKFPLFVLLHGDGAAHLNYEYLGRFLASWGFAAATPFSIDDVVLSQMLEVMLHRPDSLWAPLAGKVRGDKAVVAGHSRGAQRATRLATGPSRNLISGVVYLAPFRTFDRLPAPSLIFAASGDRQAWPNDVYVLWKRQQVGSMYVFIEGGNHSQFTDVRHWETMEASDARATMPRNRQFAIVQSYVLAFLQQVFNLPPNFPELTARPGAMPGALVEMR